MRKRIEGLDGLRGLAAVAVVFCHCAAGSTQIGGIAVGTFFALSGYLVLNILHAGRRRVERGERSFARELASFWSRRATRILPAYYAVAVIVLTALVVAGSLPFVDSLYFLAYVQNFYIATLGHFPPFGYTWTLAVEQQFYVAFAPLMLLVVARRHVPMLLALWLGLLAIVLACLYAHVDTFALFLWPLTGFALAAAGGLFAIDADDGVTRWLLHPRVAFASFLIVALLTLVPNAFASAHPKFNIVQIAASTIAIPSLVAYVAKNPESRATRILEHRLLAFYGSISYSLYLIHGAIVEWIKPHWPILTMGPRWMSFAGERLSLFVTVMAVSTVLATISYQLLERRFLRRSSSEARSPPLQSASLGSSA